MPKQKNKNPQRDKERREREKKNKPAPTPPAPDDETPVDPWEGFVSDLSPREGGRPPSADLVAPRGTPQWKKAVIANRRWEGNQIGRNAALTGLNYSDPKRMEELMRMSGIWQYKPDDPSQVSHKWKLWSGQLPEEGFGMTNVGPYSVPYATQAYPNEQIWARDYAVQGGHLLKGAVAGTYISPQNDGTAVVQDQFGNPIDQIPWPPTPPAPTFPDQTSATSPPPPPPTTPPPTVPPPTTAPSPPPPSGPGGLNTTGFGLNPQQTQQLTNSMSAGFGIPPVQGAAPASAPAPSTPTQRPPSQTTTYSVKKSGFDLNKERSPHTPFTMKPETAGNWYSQGFGL